MRTNNNSMLNKVLAVSLIVILLCIYFPLALINGDPSASVKNVNTWGTGGQIELDLSGCSGYQEITVIVHFDGVVSSASGWGFDSYEVDGSNVISKVSASGPNSWGMDGSVGIQVEGSGIEDASLVSISGSSSGSATGTTTTSLTTSAQASSEELSVNDTTDNSSQEGTNGDDWLTTDGATIVDLNGNDVWLTGVNWFGYNTGSNLFDGVWATSLSGALRSIADHGFNLLRVPMSAELLINWRDGIYPEANYNHAYNSELESMNSLEIWDYVLSLCEQNGIKVMIDIHSAKTDAMGHMSPLWFVEDFSSEQYLEALDFISSRYSDNDTIVAYDLKNEPHGAAYEERHAIWNDSTDDNNWKYWAEIAGGVVLDNNPNALIMIEGIQIYPIDISSNNFTSTNEGDYYNSWWGGNLRGVRNYPIDMGSPERNAQVVYSPHDYGPAVYAQPWFEGGFSYESLIEDYWYDSWLYIDNEEIAPLLIGEWGGFMSGDNLIWMEFMRQLISENHLNHTFWCFNANSGDTGGLVLDDFTTWDEEKYAFVEEVLWQTEEGMFIGLDHQIPLGANGISLGEYYGDFPTPVAPRPTEEPDITEESTSVSPTTSLSDINEDEDSSKDEELPFVSSMKIVIFIAIGVVVVAILAVAGVYVYKLVKILKSKHQDDFDD